MAFIEVSKAEFFGVIGKRNVHPHPKPECSIWEDVSTREVVGRTEPGYRGAFWKPHRYWLAEKYASPRPADEERGNDNR